MLTKKVWAVFWWIIETLIDFIFPKDARIREIETGRQKIEWNELKPARPFDVEWMIAVTSYENNLAKLLVQEIKHVPNKKVAAILADSMAENLAEKIHNLASDEKIYIVPIPLFKQKQIDRGFNQASLLASAIVEKIGSEKIIYADLLVKQKTNQMQKKLKRKERLKNVHETFAAVGHEKIVGEKIILIDDIITTGATMAEARAVLLEAHAKDVVCLAFAH